MPLNPEPIIKPSSFFMMKLETACLFATNSLASTLIFTHPYGGGIHFTMDRGLGCFKVNVLPRYSIPKPLVKVTTSSILFFFFSWT
ncbi:hypothetical protein ES319_D05G014000v1 [Gossypium barbadense]|uniref:Uncharacterized protein n=1 Tax=Gossypium barbadense TaxID=3634 RepID=A0A5J5RA33_GOSBA|nr:hypothetical protein ES319_D05G014000v1 [Gossypium barbadense]